MPQNPSRSVRLPAILAIAALSVMASFGLGMKLSGDVQTVDTTKASDVLAGDMDDSGTVDRRDVEIMMEIANGTRTATPKQLSADPNQDGKITLDDALRVLRELPPS